jgi:hypothetical protein
MKRFLFATIGLQSVIISALPMYAMADSETDTVMRVEAQREWGMATQGRAISITTNAMAQNRERPLSLTMTVKNVGAEDVEFPSSTTPLGIYSVQVFGPKEEQAPLTLYGKSQIALIERRKELSITSMAYETLKPGEEYSRELPLGRIYDLSMPGKYTVIVELKFAKVPNDINSEMIKATSNKVTITIEDDDVSPPQPRNSKRLLNSKRLGLH